MSFAPNLFFVILIFIMLKRKVAFFDIDGTIFRWSLFIEYTEKLVEKNIFPQDALQQAQKKKELWLNREGSYNDYLTELIKVFDENIKGVLLDDFLDTVREALYGKEKRVYLYTKNLLQDLKGEGYFCVAITRSAKLAADIFAQSYGFDKVYGLMFDFDENGRFSGEILNEDLIFNKGKIVKRVLEKEDLNLTLKDSVAVGDTESDIPMLELVERPVAFNPSRALYEHAKKKGWQIVVERKDVVYHIR